MSTKTMITPGTPVRLTGTSRCAGLSLALLASSLSLGTAQAVNFNLGEVEGRFNSQISVGISWRAEDRDQSLIAGLNGGDMSILNNGVNDDGNLNFDDGDAFSKIFKGVHDLELSYQNLGLFVRGKYWSDFALEDDDRPWGNAVNGYTSGVPLSDEGFNDFAKFSGAELLDAFVYGDFELGDKPLDARLGRQVVSWGESTFIQGGINAINPIDVSAFRRPGAEIKEGLLPVNLLFANLGATDNLSVEGFYQLEWEPTAIDGCGTYFSNVDYVAKGCDPLTVATAALAVPLFLDDAGALAAGFTAGRAATREADDEGQYGLAFRFIAEELNDTEFGIYYTNLHSRIPVVSGFNAENPLDPFGFGPTAGAMYFTEYTEDIKTLGLSFATNVGEFALSGEISHRQDLPIQINGADLLGSILLFGTTGRTDMDIRVTAAGPGGEVQGYELFDVSQAQLTMVRFYEQVMGASRVILVGELGYTRIANLPQITATSLRFGRPSEYGAAGDDGFITEDSWGYRARAIFKFNDAFAGVNLTPVISWSHDVDGYSPANSSGFIEDRKALGLALNADYLGTYTAGISYTRFSGGDFNITKDRDFISATFGVSF